MLFPCIFHHELRGFKCITVPSSGHLCIWQGCMFLLFSMLFEPPLFFSVCMFFFFTVSMCVCVCCALFYSSSTAHCALPPAGAASGEGRWGWIMYGMPLVTPRCCFPLSLPPSIPPSLPPSSCFMFLCPEKTITNSNDHFVWFDREIVRIKTCCRDANHSVIHTSLRQHRLITAESPALFLLSHPSLLSLH